jgi:outer membrane immunogenic protein
MSRGGGESEMFKKILLMSAALVALTSGAYAADIVEAPPAAYDWSGLYIGGHIGYGWASVDYDTSLTGEEVNTDPEGILGGGQVGYNFDLGGLVIGPEVSFTFTDIDGGDFDSDVNTDVTYSGAVDWYAIFGGRIGFAADRWLVFARGGYAIGDVKTEGENDALPDAFDDSETHDGFAIGGGFEYAWTDEIIVGADYTFIDLGKEDHDGHTDLGIPYTNADVDTEIHAVTARISFKFGAI